MAGRRPGPPSPRDPTPAHLDLSPADPRGLHPVRRGRARRTTSRELGVGAVYLSPILQSTSARTTATTPPTHAGSTRIAAGRRLGGVAGGRAARPARAWWSTSCRTTSASPCRRENPAWWDVLRLGRASRVRVLVRHRLEPAGSSCRSWATMPTLTVADGELRYFEHRFPLAPGTLVGGRRTRRRCTPGSTTSWCTTRRGNAELNYRRFFAVTTLAGVRVEDADVFAATHERIAGLGRRPASPGCGSTTRTVWSIRRSTWSGCGRWRPAPGSRWRRSWSPASSCRTGRWPAPPGYDAMREVDGVFVDRRAPSRCSPSSTSG